MNDQPARPNVLVGATFLSCLLTRDREMEAAMRSAYEPVELLDSLLPQLKILALRVARAEGISLEGIAERMVGAAVLFTHLDIDPSRFIT